MAACIDCRQALGGMEDRRCGSCSYRRDRRDGIPHVPGPDTPFPSAGAPVVPSIIGVDYGRIESRVVAHMMAGEQAPFPYTATQMAMAYGASRSVVDRIYGAFHSPDSYRAEARRNRESLEVAGREENRAQIMAEIYGASPATARRISGASHGVHVAENVIIQGSVNPDENYYSTLVQNELRSYGGGVVSLPEEKTVDCPSCDGLGHHMGLHEMVGGYDQCKSCKGSGKITEGEPLVRRSRGRRALDIPE